MTALRTVSLRCEACGWRGTSIPEAANHENQLHDGAQTCWYEREAPKPLADPLPGRPDLRCPFCNGDGKVPASGPDRGYHRCLVCHGDGIRRPMPGDCECTHNESVHIEGHGCRLTFCTCIQFILAEPMP